MTALATDLRNAWAATLVHAANTLDNAADDTTPDEQPTDEGATDEELRDPRIKKLHDEAARYRTTAKAEKERADKAESTLRTLALRTAFDRAAAKVRVEDVEAAWKLAADDVQALEVNADGTVDAEALGDILRTVAARHPGVMDEVCPQPSGRPTSGSRKAGEGLNRNHLEKKFPALRRARNS